MTTPWDPQEFEHLGQKLLKLMREHLGTLSTRPDDIPVYPDISPTTMLEQWPADFSVKQDPLTLCERVLAGSHHLHHPRYVGHQVTSPLPASALFSFLSAFLNNGSAVYEMGPVSSAMERRVLQWMASRLGFPAGSDGVLTSGGSMGNLTALLAARQAKAGWDVWQDGGSQGPPLAVLVSDQAHYCVKRAAHIMGWGDEGVIRIGSDQRYRMRVDLLPQAMETARQRGRKVIAVVGSACSTPTGAIDPLQDIADFASQENLWFHVDGAHGASFILAPSVRNQLVGIERADSIVWDAHKMMLTPALATAVLFREGRHSYQVFNQHESYLFHDPSRDEYQWWDIGKRTLECTKSMLGFVLYATLATHGEAYFVEYLEQIRKLSLDFAAVIQASSDFELAVQPDANILCFRYMGKPGEDRNAQQEMIRSRIIHEGRFYLVQTRLRDSIYLRMTLINPRTSMAELGMLLDEIRRIA